MRLIGLKRLLMCCQSGSTQKCSRITPPEPLPGLQPDFRDQREKWPNRIDRRRKRPKLWESISCRDSATCSKAKVGVERRFPKQQLLAEPHCLLAEAGVLTDRYLFRMPRAAFLISRT